MFKGGPKASHPHSFDDTCFGVSLAIERVLMALNVNVGFGATTRVITLNVNVGATSQATPGE